MNKFSDFGIPGMENKKIFNVPTISISEIVNCEIEVYAYETGVATSFGKNRYVVNIVHEGTEKKFFTDCKNIKEIIDRIPKESFPFKTTIKQQKFGTGNKKTYYFT